MKKKRKFGIKREPVVKIWIPKNKRIKNTIYKKKLLIPIIEGPIVKPGVFVINEEYKKKENHTRKYKKKKKLKKMKFLKN